MRAALDLLVATDGRYRWQQTGETVVIRPTAAWEDEEHLLHAAAGVEQADDQPLAEALRQVLGGAPLAADLAPLTAAVDRGVRVARPSQPATTLARLSALAATGQLFVQVWDPRLTVGAIADVAAWDGHSYPIQQQETAP